jgi:hypothetical protein
MMTSCYLLHSGVFNSADEAINFVTLRRQLDKRWLFPSQIRYVYYYEALLRNENVECRTYRVSHLRITTVPSFSSSLIELGCSPILSISCLARDSNAPTDVSWLPKKVFDGFENLRSCPPRRYSSERDNVMDFSFDDYKSNSVRVRGDVCVSGFSDGGKLFQVYFNTCFVTDSYLVFDQCTTDIAHMDENNFTFDKNFKVEIFLEAMKDDPSLNVLPRPPSTNASDVEFKTWEHIKAYGDTNIEEDNF